MPIRIVSTLASLGAVIGALLLTLSGERESAVPTAPPVVIFRSLAAGDEHGRLVMLGLFTGGVRRAGPLSCTRVHYAGGRGVCTVTESSGDDLAHVAYSFDDTLAPGIRIALDGVPTRMRVAPTGRVAAITTFGDATRQNGVATNSIVVDLRSGAVTADFRQFELDSIAAPPLAHAATVSSVAFEPDGNRFFATLTTDDAPVLVAGSLTERRMTVLRSGVFNEALSPDGRRLVVKKLRAERGFWQLAVIDLATWQELELPQGPRSVDDQVEWLNNQYVMYHDVDGDTTSLWILAADGGSPPRVLVKNAYSGSVQR